MSPSPTGYFDLEPMVCVLHEAYYSAFAVAASWFKKNGETKGEMGPARRRMYPCPRTHPAARAARCWVFDCAPIAGVVKLGYRGCCLDGGIIDSR